MALIKSSMPLYDTLSAYCYTAADQLDMGAIIQTGAAVASIINASLALETRCLSVSGIIIFPTVKQLK